MNIRTTFYGKSFGHIKSSGSFTRARIKAFPLFTSVAEAQTKLDEFARSRGLSEVAE